MRLLHLTLTTIIDVAYLCGLDRTPVTIIISAPPGAGKTWATQSIAESNLVQYIGGVHSPNEHRKIIGDRAARTRLIINDDLGLSARWNMKEYIATFIMIANGDLEFTMHKQSQHESCNASLILCCTAKHFDKVKDDMKEMGLWDRSIPIDVRLSKETRQNYQINFVEKTAGIYDKYDDRMPPQRHPELRPKHQIKTPQLLEKDVDPRLLRNLSYMSQYLSDDEYNELIDVALNPRKYEI
jgi:hypothetical protein